MKSLNKKLAETVATMLRRSKGQPIRFEDIAEQHFPADGDTIEIQAVVRKSLRSVKDILRRETEFEHCYLVADYFWTTENAVCPQTEGQARMCLAGQRRPAVGIGNARDLIALMASEHKLDCGDGAVNGGLKGARRSEEPGALVVALRALQRTADEVPRLIQEIGPANQKELGK